MPPCHRCCDMAGSDGSKGGSALIRNRLAREERPSLETYRKRVKKGKARKPGACLEKEKNQSPVVFPFADIRRSPQKCSRILRKEGNLGMPDW
jgi:hypothetical protein